MSTEGKYTKGEDEDLSCGLLLRDIEEIGKALYLHEAPHKTFNSSYNHRPGMVAKTGIPESKSNALIQDSMRKDKKSSIWNWKPLKALTHINHHHFNCCFFLHVHTIEGLPPNLDNVDLCVTWKRKSNTLRTHPARASLGMAEFEQTLMLQCPIYCSRSGFHNSVKYEPNLFLLRASVIGALELDVGNYWIDLSRLLPLTLEELEDKRSSGKWTTSFKLSSKAKGAMLNVSFGFSILDGNSCEPSYFVKFPDIVREGELSPFADFGWRSTTRQLHNLDSVPRISTEGSDSHSQYKDVRFLEEVFPNRGSELSHSVKLLYRKLNEGKVHNAIEFDLYHKHLDTLKPKSDPSPESSGRNSGYEFNDTDFDIIEQGVEVSMEDQRKMEECGSHRFDSSAIETLDVAEIFKGEEFVFDEYVECNTQCDTNNHNEYEYAGAACQNRENSTCILEQVVEELDSSFCNTLTSKPAQVDSLLDITNYYEQENYMTSQSSSKVEGLMKTFSLDDVAESIENDFLNMLSADHSQDGIVSGSGFDPPGDFLRGIQEDRLAQGNLSLSTDLIAEQEECFYFTPSSLKEGRFAEAFDLSFATEAVERNHGSVNQPLRSKRNAKMLENLETKALMLEWGLNENTFQYSPQASSGGFGSPVYVPAEKPLKLPSIEDGVGPIIWTKDGGFLRSLNPLFFRNANNGARLIVQVSAPVVLPSAMGLSVMETLQYWASVGVEKMCIQANELMPMADVTGKTMRQVVSEAESRTALKRWSLYWKSEVDLESSIERKTAKHLPFDQSSDTLYSCSNPERVESDYVSFEDLVPMAMTNIEGLLVEGLKIQSGMADQDAPSSIRIEPAENSSMAGEGAEHSSNLFSERASELQVLDIDGLIKYSLTLEEWIKLDSGEFNVEDGTHENILKLFAPIELVSGKSMRDDETVKMSRRSHGVFSDNFRMCLKLQLRDPLRNYEMVGSPMLVLIQVERACSAPREELHCLSSEKICNGKEDGLDENMVLEGIALKENQKKICEPLFKISDICLAGLNVLCGNGKLWSTYRQQQSGSRWLLSSGMVRSNKTHVSNSNAIIKFPSGLMRSPWPVDVLWSISFPSPDEAATWDEQVALNVHVRNPDIVFPTISVK